MIHFSNHAIDRYRERVKPAMQRNHVKRELKHLATLATMTEAPPDWIGNKPSEDPHRYIEITDGICFSLVKVPDGWLATTCLIRGGHINKYRKPKPRRVNDFYTSRPKRVRRNQLRRAA